jgi:phi13 family phage major tail protein
MAIKGLSIPVFGKYAYDATTKKVTYTNGITGGNAIEYTISVESSENNPLYANNQIVENDTGKFNTGTLSLGTDDLMAEVSKYILGLKEKSITVVGLTGVTETIYDDDAKAPALGFGIIEMHQKDDVDKYKAVILTKVNMNLPEDTATTKGQSIEWQTKTIEGTIQRSEEVSTDYNHPWKREAWFTTEADALTYLKAVLGVVEEPEGGQQ